MADEIWREAELVDSYFRKNRRKPPSKALNFLLFLVNRKVEGKFASPGGRHTDTDIALEFYNNWNLEKQNMAKPQTYMDIRDAANHMRVQVRDLLSEYYRDQADPNCRLDIVDERDRFEPFLSSTHSEQMATSSALPQEGPGIKVSPVWKTDHVHELLRTVAADTELRIHITGFADVRPMRTTLRRALSRRAHIRILQVDPDGPLIEARFRLRPELTVAEFRSEMRQQQKILTTLAKESRGGSIEHRVSDLMPVGHFIQGTSIDVGPWIVIGLLPPVAPYSEGPMIEITPAATELWSLFETSWIECWNSPMNSGGLNT